MKRATLFITNIFVYSSLIILTDAHGHMTSPRSRNWFAHEDGIVGWDSPQPGVPPKENCPHCLNANLGVCGKVSNGGRSYDPFLDSKGQPMPWISQATYNEGGTILVKSYLDTHHNGHMTISACADGPNSKQECFNKPENFLKFVKDISHNMPSDPDYPERGYYAGGQGGGLKNFEFLYELPDGISGDQVMLQWKYITANSCSPPGYSKYFQSNKLPDSYWTKGLTSCIPPYSPDGSRNTTTPEQFFNCAEVSVTPSGPTTPTTLSPIVAPTPAPNAPVAPTAPTTKAPTSSSKPCCTRDFKNCNVQLEGWCSESKENCVNSCMKFWLPNGALKGCTARYESCTSDEDCCSPGTCIGGMCELGKNPPGPTPTRAPSPSVSPPTSSGDYCCSQNFRDCVTWCGTTKEECESCDQDVFWIKEPPSSCKPRWESCTGSPTSCCPGLTCVGDQYYSQCKYEQSPPTNPAPTASPVVSPPSTTPPTRNPTTSAPTTTPKPGSLFSCSAGKGQSTWDSLRAMESITKEVSKSPNVLAVVSSGGAAGDGSYVVSESQAYGVLSAGLTLMSMEEGDENYEQAKLKFQGYFNGWRQMCRKSAPAKCQNPVYCDNGSTPCLPGWKHTADFSNVVGTGSAPDGDEDAIVGMIIALKAVESDSVLPKWYDEVKDWADRSCTQFLQDNTILSDTGSHRLLKLGSCWGGWELNGNNPSYHAPGHFRMMRDFQSSIESRSYTLPSYVNEDSWNNVIDTSYKFFKTTQCSDTGLVPNWALVKEINSQTLAKNSGSFSGSGTPQYEFGAEASRTIWRVAFDAAAYPEESAAQSGSFLSPLHTKLIENFNPNPSNGWEHFGVNSLQACSPIVKQVFGSWQWNYFISAPVYSSLVTGFRELPKDKTFDQQTMVDAACEKVSKTAGQKYYPLSWQVLAQMMLNGEVAKAGGAFHTQAPQANPTTMSPAPTKAPTKAPTTNCSEDGSKEFLLSINKKGKIKTKNCAWLKKKGRKALNICKKKVAVTEKYNSPQYTCRVTCKSCDPCYQNDKSKFFYKATKKGAMLKTCLWLKNHKNPSSICKKNVSKNGYGPAKEICPQVCNAACA